MENPNRQGNPCNCSRQRRRRRREFIDALRQSQNIGCVPIIDVGQRLREKRVDSGLTIRDLAKKSGLNVNTLSMIENGKASQSIETLQQLSFAIEMPIAAFFEAITPKNKIAHLKAKQRECIAFAHGTLEDLGESMPRRGAETFLVTLKPLSSSGDDLIVHTGRETVFCLEGWLTYAIEDRTFVLEPGDSLCFDAHLPHRWQNTGTTPTRSLLVLCPSDEQDRPTEQHFAPQVASMQEA